MAQLTLDCAYPHTFTLIEGRLLSGIQGPPELWRAGQRLIRANLALSALIYLTEGFLGHYCPDGQSSAVILLPNTPGNGQADVRHEHRACLRPGLCR